MNWFDAAILTVFDLRNKAVEAMEVVSSAVNNAVKASEKTPLVPKPEQMSEAPLISKPPMRKHSPWNIALLVIFTLAMLSLTMCLITYFMMKKAEQEYNERVEHLMKIYVKKLEDAMEKDKEVKK